MHFVALFLIFLLMIFSSKQNLSCYSQQQFPFLLSQSDWTFNIYSVDYSTTSNYYIFGGSIKDANNDVVPLIGQYINGGPTEYNFLSFAIYYSHFGDGLNMYITSVSLDDSRYNIFALMRSATS